VVDDPTKQTSSVAGFVTLFDQASGVVPPANVAGTPEKIQPPKRTRRNGDGEEHEISAASDDEADRMQ
jgi:hypothetical protein